METQVTVQRPAKIFFSYVRDVKRFVDAFAQSIIDDNGRLAREDWLLTPAPAGASLSETLNRKIAAADVFVAFVDKTYNDRIAARELQMALERRAAGSSRPLLVPIILGITGLNWWNAISNQVRIPQDLSDVVREGFYEKGTEIWQIPTPEGEQHLRELRDWIIKELFPVIGPTITVEPPLPSLDVAAAEPPSQVAKTRRLALLGRPEGEFAAEVCASRDSFSEALADVGAFDQVGDGWHDAEEWTAAEIAAAVAKAGASSLLVQACDAAIYRRYTYKGKPPKPARAFGNDLTERGLPDDEVPAVIERTLFWVPRIGAELAELERNGLDVPEVADADLTAKGPWYGTAAPEELVRRLLIRPDEEAPVVKVQAGLRELGDKLSIGLKPFFGRPVFVEQVGSNFLPVKVREAATSGVPIIVAIHDRSIETTTAGRQLESLIRRHAEDFDAKIEEAIEGVVSARVARAVLLVRYPDTFQGSEEWNFGNGSWVLVPLARNHDYEPPPYRLNILREQLRTGDAS